MEQDLIRIRQDIAQTFGAILADWSNALTFERTELTVYAEISSELSHAYEAMVRAIEGYRRLSARKELLDTEAVAKHGAMFVPPRMKMPASYASPSFVENRPHKNIRTGDPYSHVVSEECAGESYCAWLGDEEETEVQSEDITTEIFEINKQNELALETTDIEKIATENKGERHESTNGA